MILDKILCGPYLDSNTDWGTLLHVIKQPKGQSDVILQLSRPIKAWRNDINPPSPLDLQLQPPSSPQKPSSLHAFLITPHTFEYVYTRC